MYVRYRHHLLRPEKGGGTDLNRNHISPRKRVCVGAAQVVVDQETPCVAPIILLQREFNDRVFSLLGQMLHCWVGQYGTEKTDTERTRCRSRNTPTKRLHAYLVKPKSLLPGPGAGEVMSSTSVDPNKNQYL